MKPVFIVNGHDYTAHVAWDGLKSTRNDLDKDGAGRNILDGLMYRKRIATKLKWTVSFLRLDETTLRQLEADMDHEFVDVTLLEARTNTRSTRTYYTSTINEGVQRYAEGHTVYDGVTFEITER